MAQAGYVDRIVSALQAHAADPEVLRDFTRAIGLQIRPPFTARHTPTRHGMQTAQPPAITPVNCSTRSEHVPPARTVGTVVCTPVAAITRLSGPQSSCGAPPAASLRTLYAHTHDGK